VRDRERVIKSERESARARKTEKERASVRDRESGERESERARERESERARELTLMAVATCVMCLVNLCVMIHSYFSIFLCSKSTQSEIYSGLHIMKLLPPSPPTPFPHNTKIMQEGRCEGLHSGMLHIWMSHGTRLNESCRTALSTHD